MTGPYFLDFAAVIEKPQEKGIHMGSVEPKCNNLTYYDLNIESDIKSSWPAMTINNSTLLVNANKPSHIGSFPV